MMNRFPDPSALDVSVVYVAIGDAARAQVEQSIVALRRLNCAPLPVMIYSNDHLNVWTASTLVVPERLYTGYGGRRVKLALDYLAQSQYALYLDADTRPRSDPLPLYAPLLEGFDVVIAPSANQGVRAFQHVDADERTTTLDDLGYTPVQWQAGVFAFARTDAVQRFFAAWREAYEAGPATEDQAAFVRALHRSPLKMWVLSEALVDRTILHLFGALRPKGKA